MKNKTKEDELKQKGQTLEEFFEQTVGNAKAQAEAAALVADFMLKVVAEFGQLTAEVGMQINKVLEMLDKEMDGLAPSQATPAAHVLRGQAEAFSFVADQMTAMIKRLEENKNETIH